MARSKGNYPPQVLTQQLLLSVVEQLKMPLLSVARRAELGQAQPNADDLQNIQTTAEAALQLLDNYTLGVQLASDELRLSQAEPVAVSSVLYSAGQRLRPIAKAYGVELEIEIDGKYGPVMAHRRGLEAALVSLGYALVEAMPAQDVSRLRLQLSAHRCRYGVVAGMYCETEEITTAALKMGRQLYGRARQPLGAISHTGSAGVFVADAILHAMNAQLTISRHGNLYGLGAVLPLNPQLQLV